VVDAQCAGAVAVQRVELHQPAVADLAQRVVVQQARRVPDRRAQVAQRFEQIDQLLQRFEIDLAQALADREHPLIVALREQIAPVVFKSLFERRTDITLAGSAPGRGDQRLELIDIQLKRGRGPPVQRSCANLEILVDRWKALPQMMQRVAQIGVRLAFR
jgi:hypothetical protein